jgi:hypothetical protein
VPCFLNRVSCRGSGGAAPGYTSGGWCMAQSEFMRSARAGFAWLAFALIAAPLAAADTADEQAMAQRVSAELKAVQSLKVWPKPELNALIMQERFAEFEALSRQYESNFKKEPKYESSLVALYMSLDIDNDAMLEKLHKWVATRPSYMSHGARGIYNRYRGYRARGTKFSQDTPQAQMARMSELHRQAIPDLLIALGANRRFSPAYISLLAIQRTAGDIASAERTVNEAVRWIPETYYVRRSYLIGLRPQWGGDYSLMQAYARSLDEASRLNPRIWSLNAELPAELGHSAWVSRDYADAIRYYTEALRYGDNLEFLKNRGQIFWATRQYAQARRDFARYTQYDKSDEQVNGWLRSLDKF